MKLRHVAELVLVLIGSVLAANVEAAGVRLVGVYVTCDGHDVVGANLCFNVKEKIRASAGFRLLDDPSGRGVGVHLVTVDDSPTGFEGASSAVSVTYTTFLGSSLEYFETAQVIEVGSERVREMATSVLSRVDRVAADNARFFK